MTSVEEAAAAMVAEAVRLPTTERVEAVTLAFRIIAEGGLFEGGSINTAGARLVGRALTAWGNAMKWFVHGCVAPSGMVNCHGAYMLGPDVCAFCGEPMGKVPRKRAWK